LSVYPRYFLLLLITTVLLQLAYSTLPNLLPQEAYYWLYAKHLDWSYFDHPPMTAWSIALSTYLGGDSVLFVRLPAIVFHAGGSLAAYLLAREMLQSERLAFWVVLTMQLMVIFAIGGIIITPDVPMICFWGFTLWAVLRALKTEKWWWWHVSGILLGVALLSKYSAGLIVGCVFLLLLLGKEQRRWLASPHPYLGLLWALAVFAPVVIWNAQHDWASFAFQSTRRLGMMESFRPLGLVNLVGTQLFVVTPLLFVGLLYALWYLTRRWWRDRGFNDLFILAFSVPVLLLFAAVSVRTQVKLNWPAPAYLTGAMALVLVWAEKVGSAPHRWRRWVAAAGVSGATLVAVVYALPAMPLPLGGANSWSGWPQLAQRIESIKAEFPREPFLFSDGHKTSSEIAYYTHQPSLVLAENIYGDKALQFDYWLKPMSLTGRDALLVQSDTWLLSPKQMEAVRRRFQWISEPEPLPITRKGRKVREFYIIRCFNYLGT
jgi:4-amino-4-deoxy-L-arabinose transferase-like glycosyltransferase